MSLKLEAGKFYRTRKGDKVRIYATDGSGFYTVQGAIAESNGSWTSHIWTASGKFNVKEESSYRDIVSTWEEAKPMKLYRYKLTGSLHLLEKVDRPEDYEEIPTGMLK